MSYTVTILNKKYDLPARTLFVDEGIEAMSKLYEQYNSKEITRRDVVLQMHNFVESIVPGAVPSVEEVDTNDLLKTCLDIITTYDAPARKARTEAKLSDVKELLARPEVQKILSVADKVSK